MAISLLDGTNIDIMNVVLFKTDKKTFYNHEYEGYNSYQDLFIKYLEKIIYIYSETEYQSSESWICFTKEKHFIKNCKHHRLDGPAIHTYDSIYHEFNDDERTEENESMYYISGILYREEDFFNNQKVIQYKRSKKLKRIFDGRNKRTNSKNKKSL